MSDPLTYMNTLTQWKEPPPWDVKWAHTVGQACQMISERDLQIDNLHKMLVAEQCKVGQLLAACEAVVEECDATFVDTSEMSAEWREVEQMCRAAIAAAKGEGKP